nr:putative RING-H2 finger protein ATL21A [Ipomoea trifida]
MFTSASATHLLFLSILLFIISSALAADDACRPVACNDVGPEIRFPFRLKGRQPARCGYRGFDLTCNARGETILRLPNSGEFAVSDIVYMSQIVYLYDPDFCPAKKLLNFSLAGSAFRGAREASQRYTILRCSKDWSDYTSYRAIPLFCGENMGSSNNTVLAMTPRMYAREKPPACRPVKKNATIPLSWDAFYQFWEPFKQLELTWDKPDCRNCEAEDQLCGFRDDSGGDIVCSKFPSKGIPRGVKYGITIGIGIPGLVCTIGLACFACGKIRDFRLNRRLSSMNLSTTGGITVQPPLAIAGLDRQTIESYPVTVLGESRRLPKPNDGLCPICLSEYEAKETLRSIPECNHYFHADCIDEWLKLNATCPLCRNSPESPWTNTPCSSMSLSSTSLASSSGT